MAQAQAAKNGDRRVLDAGRKAHRLAKRLAVPDDPASNQTLEDLDRKLLDADRAVVLAEAKQGLLAEFADHGGEKTGRRRVGPADLRGNC